MQSIALNTLEDTIRLAQQVAKAARVGDVIALKGDLGAGKTAFARAFIQYLAAKEIEVPSPTFTLVQIYELPKVTIYHFDLYRLSSPDELLELGLEEAFAEGITLIEWPEIIKAMAIPNRLDIEFSFNDPSRTRQANIKMATSWENRLYFPA